MLNAGTKTLHKISRFSDQKINGENESLEILDIKATEWEGKIIIVTSLAKSYHIYMLSLLDNTPTLQPIQRLKKYGIDEQIFFFIFRGNIYCLLGSSLEKFST